jgi:hypothetical protein
LGIFQIGFHIYAKASLDSDPPIYTFQVAGMTDTCHHITQSFIDWDGVSPYFYLRWPQTTILKISASQVARNTWIPGPATFSFSQRPIRYKWVLSNWWYHRSDAWEEWPEIEILV